MENKFKKGDRVKRIPNRPLGHSSRNINRLGTIVSSRSNQMPDCCSVRWDGVKSTERINNDFLELA